MVTKVTEFEGTQAGVKDEIYLQKGGNHIIWFGLNWSLELYQQANKRLHRQGQLEKVMVHHIFVEGGVDEDVMAALEDKGATQEKLMEALKARVGKCKS